MYSIRWLIVGRCDVTGKTIRLERAHAVEAITAYDRLLQYCDSVVMTDLCAGVHAGHAMSWTRPASTFPAAL